jgi:hypothetical protein
MFCWFRPWHHHHMWRRRFWGPCYHPMGCGCLWLLLLPLFLCLAWAFFAAFTRMMWW